MIRNIKPEVDNNVSYVYTAPEMKGIKMKRRKISLNDKRKIVDAVDKSRETMNLPEACKVNNIEVYTYQNYSLSIRKALQKGRVRAIRREPIKQTAPKVELMPPSPETTDINKLEKYEAIKIGDRWAVLLPSA